eukprot:709484_1
MFLWLLALYASVCHVSVYGVDKNCHTAFECSSRDIGSTNKDAVTGGGYKSLFQSLSSMADVRWCTAALSCVETPYVIVTDRLLCNGAFSCSNMTYIETNGTLINSNIYSQGANALTNSNISFTATYDCTGVKSCAHSTISCIDSTSCVLGGHGAFSLVGSTIHGINAILTVQLYGYYAGYQTLIHCEKESICDVECSDNGCYGLSLTCDGVSRCSISPITDSVFVPSANPNVALNNEAMRAWNATYIPQINEAQCATQSTDKTFDDWQERANSNEAMIYTTYIGPICCRAFQACTNAPIIYNSTSSLVVCSGEESCLDTPIISNSTTLNVECSAKSACRLASITTNGGNIYCSAAWSCSNSIITKVSNVYCNAYGSCSGATIMSSGTNISVYFSGYRASSSTSVICNENDYCTILCSGYQSCTAVYLTCNGTCAVECSKNAFCPEGYTVSPSSKPTLTPTLPTMAPTLRPSKVPTTAAPTTDTLYPTVTPSAVPSESPTSPPTTHIPTAVPSFQPTLPPTWNPSNNPTWMPTANPSKTPTVPPSLHPTMIPTVSPSQPPTYFPTDVDEAKKAHEESLQNIVDTFQSANIGIVSAFAFLAITGFIDAKLLRVNDVFSFGKILQPLLQTLDAMSDVFLCYEVSLIHDYVPEDQSAYLVLLICMIMFVVIPISYSIIQLATISNKYWINNKDESVFYVVNNAAIRVWFGKYVHFLYFVSVITGSSFGATALFNSNLYGLPLFDMGLSESTLTHFKTKRLYSVIMCENIPQVILQFVYWTISRTQSIIVVISMVYSGISILVTLITIYTQKRIIYMQQAVCIQFDVTGTSIAKHSAKLRNRFHGIQREISKLLGVDKAVIEVIRPMIIANGIRIMLLIKVDGDVNEHLVRFKTTMHDSDDTNNALFYAVKNGWDLEAVNDDRGVQISDIQLSAKESKQAVQESRHIQLSKATDSQQEIKSLAQDDDNTTL